VVTQASAGFDLLVTSAPAARLPRALLATETERIVKDAACSVLALRASRVRSHDTVARDKPTALGQACLVPRLALPDVVGARLSARNKSALFRQLADRFAHFLDGRVTRERIVAELWKRERNQNTCIGHGVALPHALLPGLSHTTWGLFTTSWAIDYGGLDRRHVDVLWVALSPPDDRQTHLLLLSRVPQLCRETNLLDELRRARFKHQMRASVRRAAAEIEGIA
jgi:PTS system nitrogen regulatory IIA component